MKTNKIIAMSLLAALAVGCSSDDIVDDGGKAPGTTEGTSYVSMNITLPSTNGNRAEGDANADADKTNPNPNDKFDAGTADEYKVNEVKISFYTLNENTYTHIENADLTYSSDELAWTASSTDGITTTALLPVKQVIFADNVEAYALVEVNPVAGIDDDDWAVNPTNAASTKITVDRLTKNKDGESAFFMTNTVWDDGHYLVPIKSYKTKLEAQNNAHNYNVFVERAVAKTTLKVADSWSNGTYSITTEGSVYKDAKVTINGWKLDVTNKKMYPVRKFAGSSTFTASDYGRFYGGSKYRTYWAEDPNYSDYDPKNTNDNNFTVIKDASKISNAVGADEYCLENTFNTVHQKQNETTRVLVKATFIPSGITFEQGATDKTWYTIGNSTTAYTGTTLVNKIKEVLNTSSDVTLSALNAGETTVDASTFTVSGVTDESKKAENVAKVKNVLGSKITTYKNGECFYAIRIRHLDYYCPWGGETGAPTKDGSSYVTYAIESEGKPVADMEKNYLGRYGVVRNNWYQVTINSVTQPGSPTIPELTVKQDDEQYYYLQANINILDWAVRTQGVDL